MNLRSVLSEQTVHGTNIWIHTAKTRTNIFAETILVPEPPENGPFRWEKVPIRKLFNHKPLGQATSDHAVLCTVAGGTPVCMPLIRIDNKSVHVVITYVSGRKCPLPKQPLCHHSLAGMSGGERLRSQKVFGGSLESSPVSPGLKQDLKSSCSTSVTCARPTDNSSRVLTCPQTCWLGYCIVGCMFGDCGGSGGGNQGQFGGGQPCLVVKLVGDLRATESSSVCFQLQQKQAVSLYSASAKRGALAIALCPTHPQTCLRVPPTWGLECEHHHPSYNFRAWTKDIRPWPMLTDFEPRQQAASIVWRLTGQAGESPRTLTHAELQQGGVLHGLTEILDPVTYTLAGLAMKYEQLGDRTRLTAMVEFQAFQRRHGESVSELLDQYDASTQQSSTYLAPFGCRFPNKEHEFRELQSHMRRLGHIAEYAPNSVAQSMQGGRQAMPGAYFQEVGEVFYQTPDMARNFTSGGEYRQDAPIRRHFLIVRTQARSWDGFGGWQPDNSNHAVPGTVASYQVANDQQMPDLAESVTNTTSTGTDKSSDSGQEVLEQPCRTQNMTDEQVCLVYWGTCRTTKRNWRRLQCRPVRRFRRAIMKFKCLLFCRSNYNKSSAWKRLPNFGGRRYKRFGGRYYQEVDEFPDQHLEFNVQWVGNYLVDKRRRPKSSGEGFGRRGNKFPICLLGTAKGKELNGDCFDCGKPGHFARKCPKKKGKGKGSSLNKGGPPAPSFLVSNHAVPCTVREPDFSGGPVATAPQNEPVKGWSWMTDASYEHPPYHSESTPCAGERDPLITYINDSMDPSDGLDNLDKAMEIPCMVFSCLTSGQNTTLPPQSGPASLGATLFNDAPADSEQQSDVLFRPEGDPWNGQRLPKRPEDLPGDSRVWNFWKGTASARSQYPPNLLGVQPVQEQAGLGQEMFTPAADPVRAAFQQAQGQIRNDYHQQAQSSHWTGMSDYGVASRPRASPRAYEPGLYGAGNASTMQYPVLSSAANVPGEPGSRWANPAHDGEKPAYVEAVGNQLDDVVAEILSKARPWPPPRPQRTQSGFATSFTQHSPRMWHTVSQPCAPVQLVAQQWPNLSAPADWNVQPVEGGNWGQGTDNNAECVHFGWYQPPECDNCKTQTAIPACPICSKLLCDSCTQKGAHGLCRAGSVGGNSPGDQAPSPQPSARTQTRPLPAQSDIPLAEACKIVNEGRGCFVTGANIPTEPRFGRRQVQIQPLLIEEEIPEMRDTMSLAEMDLERMRKAQAKEMEQSDAPLGEVRDVSPKDSISQASKDFSKPGDARAEPPSAESKRPASSPDVISPGYELPIVFAGQDTVCGICGQKCYHDDRCARLRCRHAFHENCWRNHKQARDALCPNCKGHGVVIAIWDFVGSQGTDTHWVDGKSVLNLMNANVQEWRMFSGHEPQLEDFVDARSRGTSRTPTPTQAPPRSEAAASSQAAASEAPTFQGTGFGDALDF